jgi:hypothetical protein
MKELIRPSSTGVSEVRMLFAFDPTRQAIFLVDGDKAATGNAGTPERFDWRMTIR